MRQDNEKSLTELDVINKTFDAIFNAFKQVHANDPDPDLQEQLRRKLEKCS